MNKKRLLRSLATAVCATAFVAVTDNAASQAPQAFELALVDLDGTKEPLGALPVFAPRVSPDGRQLVFELPEQSGSRNARLWITEIADLDGRRALPQHGGPLNYAALWSTDGERIVYVVPGEQADAIYWRPADGSGEAEHLIDGRSEESWTPDGSQLTFLTLRAEGDYGISVLDMSTRTAETWIDLPGSAQHSSNVSPDGEWIAYTSNETGRFEVWVAPLASPSERQRVTQQGGSHPLWSLSGKALYFDRENRLYRVEVMGSDGLAIGEPAPLPIQGFVQGEYRRQFDLMPDGRRFLMLFPPQSWGFRPAADILARAGRLASCLGSRRGARCRNVSGLL